MSELNPGSNPEQERISQLEAQVAALTEENNALLAKNAELENTVRSLSERFEALESQHGVQPETEEDAEEPTRVVEADQPVEEAEVEDEVRLAPRRPRPAPERSESKVNKKGRIGVLIGGIAVAAAAAALLFGGDKDNKSHKAPTPSEQTAKANNKNNPFSKLLGTIGTVGQPAAEAATTTPPAAPTTPKPVSAHMKHELNLDHAEAQPTAARAVAELNGTSVTRSSDIRDILTAKNHPAPSHAHGAMGSMVEKFKAGHINTNDASEALAFNIAGSPAYAAKFYNLMHGNQTRNELPQGVSQAQAMKSIEAFLTHSNTDFKLTRALNEKLQNYGQHGEHVFAANVMDASGKQFLVVTGPNGKKVIIKTENLCFNLESLLPAAPATPHETVTPPAGHTTVTPPTHHTSTPPKGHGHVPGNKVTTDKHGVGKVKPGPIKPIVKHPKPKTDKNVTPGGVPGEPHGTPDKPGVGPAGQPVHPNGTVGNEQLPAPTQQDPTPAPLPVANQPVTNTPGVETGNQTTPEQAGTPTPAPTAGTTIPTGDPNPQG